MHRRTTLAALALFAQMSTAVSQVSHPTLIPGEIVSATVVADGATFFTVFTVPGGPTTTTAPGNSLQTATTGYGKWIQTHTDVTFIVFCVVVGLLLAVSIALTVLGVRMCAARRRTIATRKMEADHVRLLASQTGSTVYNSYPTTAYGYDPYKEGTGV